MDLHCKRCNALIPAEDVNVGTGVAKCRACKKKQPPTYVVRALAADGRTIPLVTGLDEPAQALYIEQSTERHLGIADHAVGDELPR